MCKDGMSRTGHDIMLRIARGRVEDRCVEGRLVLRQQAITTAEHQVVFAEDDIDRSFEQRRGRDDGAESEELAERLGLLVGDTDGEVWFCASEGWRRSLQGGGGRRHNGKGYLLLGSKLGQR